ncbi:Hypothetical protein PHPALM_17347 [Phytophthora palmivora]|uniref:Uncharacterized protein n=1 Tax=Phytophthora palmivora TaxID=4796 RepID=A0A2P4XMF8_9STRA|nr:Hypothetical protein PHPALM_17347 [Phytophthora palmivora]
MLSASKSAELLLKARTQGKNESVLHYAARYGSLSDLQSVLTLFGENAAHEVNVANTVGLTPLYLATSAPSAGSPNERRAKVAQLEKLSASLFPTGLRLFREVKNGPGVALIALHPAVRRSLAVWMVECSASSPPTFSDFCINWLACVQRPQIDVKQQGDVMKQGDTKKLDAKKGVQVLPCQRVPLSPTVAAFVCAGYAVDAVPLLLALPIKLDAIPRFLELLKALAVDTKHTMLQKLQLELVSAWKTESDDRSRKSRVAKQ